MRHQTELSISLTQAERAVVDDDVRLVVRAARRASLVHGSQFNLRLHAPRRDGDHLIVPLGALEHVFEILASVKPQPAASSALQSAQAISDRITGEAIAAGWMT